MYKIISITIILTVISIASVAISGEQKSGQPLYFDKGSITQHESDLAPHSDPRWEQEKARREAAGESMDELYREPPEIKVEETIRYERVKKKRSHKQPQRWE
jgi:hypothetical protein